MQTYNLPKRIAAEAMCAADTEIYANHTRGIFDEGDPNHPKYNNGINYVTGAPAKLFGYETREFMRKQYRVTT